MDAYPAPPAVSRPPRQLFMAVVKTRFIVACLNCDGRKILRVALLTNEGSGLTRHHQGGLLASRLTANPRSGNRRVGHSLRLGIARILVFQQTAETMANETVTERETCYAKIW